MSYDDGLHTMEQAKIILNLNQPVNLCSLPRFSQSKSCESTHFSEDAILSPAPPMPSLACKALGGTALTFLAATLCEG